MLKVTGAVRRVALASQRAAARALKRILVEPPYEDAMDHSVSFDFERVAADLDPQPWHGDDDE